MQAYNCGSMLLYADNVVSNMHVLKIRMFAYPWEWVRFPKCPQKMHAHLRRREGVEFLRLLGDPEILRILLQSTQSLRADSFQIDSVIHTVKT